ncbi:VCBS repeat-containing protein [Paenibacillaceae bacterium]|nr:VCBS repeat-containing protein [Paenibacillaceae bacterium]
MQCLYSKAVPTNYSVDNGPNFIAAGDFNNDHIEDIAVVNYNSCNIFILLGGQNGMQPVLSPGNGRKLVSAAVDDFNGDGKLDLAVAI